MNILGYSDAAQLQRQITDAVRELVLRCCVYWPNRLRWRQKVLQPPSKFMLLSWWCPLGHDKQHFIAVQFIPILTHLSSRWTVPLSVISFLSVFFLFVKVLQQLTFFHMHFCEYCILIFFLMSATFARILNFSFTQVSYEIEKKKASSLTRKPI